MNVDPTINGGISSVREDAEEQIEAFREVLQKCCQKFNIACDISVELVLSAQPAPLPNHNATSDERYQNAPQGGLGKGHVPVTYTDGISGNSASAGRAGYRGTGDQANDAVALLPGQRPQNLAHEIGHFAGYRAPEGQQAPNEPHHHSNNTNLMSRIAGAAAIEPDCIYCEDVDLLAE